MEALKLDIIQLIKRNRISSVEVADALNKTGVLPEFMPLSTGKFAVGEVQYIYGHSESNWPIHEQGKNIKDGGILFVDSFNCENKALFGDLVSKYFILYKRIEGIVANGLLRDVHTLRKENWPIWCKGFTPLGCYNKQVDLPQELFNIVEERRQHFEGAIMVCDDSGCTLIAKDLINEETKKKLEFIELQEDIWYYCTDTLKWSTYETVCLKRYLKEPEVLPPILREKLDEYDL